MQEAITTQCCIAGGGPAGIMLGYLLARAGVDVVVLEKWPDFFRDFRGDTIHPSTMELLKELGLIDRFLKLPHNEMTRMTIRVGGEEATVADLSHLHAACPFIAFIPQWDFLTFIAHEGKAYPQFKVLMSTEATDLIREGERVTGIRAKNADGPFDIRADLVIGADGRHSTLREKAGAPVTDLSVPIDVLWFRIARTDQDDQQSLGYLVPGHALVMLDRREYWQCAYIIEKGGIDAIKAKGLEAFRESISTLARLPRESVAEVDSWDKVKLLSVTVDHVSEWSQEGLLLIGDAAHAMSPLGGVGINYAIQDAVAAANILAPYFGSGPVPREALRRVQARRQKPVLKMQRLQVFIQNHVLAPVLSGKAGSRMPLVLRFFAWLPILRRIPARVIGIGFGPEHIDPSIIDGQMKR